MKIEYSTHRPTDNACGFVSARLVDVVGGQHSACYEVYFEGHGYVTYSLTGCTHAGAFDALQ